MTAIATAVRRVLAAVLFAAALVPAAHASPAEPVFGVYPYLSPSAIAENYPPLIEHLAKQLGRPIAMQSAPDFPSFVDRTARGDYDIVFTAPHMARLAEKRDGWQRVAQTAYRIQASIVVPRESPLRELADLRGHTVAVGARESMTYQLANEELRKKGLALEREVKVVVAASFSNVVNAVLRGEADAGVTSHRLLRLAPEAQRNAVREIHLTPSTPGFVIMAHPRLGAATIRKLTELLVAYKDTPDGRAFLDKNQLIEFLPLDAATLRKLDPYTAVLTQ